MSLTSQEIMAVERIMRRNHCTVCGSGLIWPRVDEAEVRCAADATHEGFTRNPPPNRPLRYGELKQRGMIRGGPNDE